MSSVGEWIDTKLHQVIESYPEYRDYELFVGRDNVLDDEPEFLGKVELVYNKYKNNYVFLTDEDNKSIGLEEFVEGL